MALSVVVPVTTIHPRYTNLLGECIESLEQQSVRPEIVIVQDGCDIWLPDSVDINVKIPARVGVPNAFNCGVASATNELVLMIGCDDILKKYAIETLQNQFNGVDAYYWLDQEFEDGSVRCEPCGHAMVTKTFWNYIGGYPLETPQACDAALVDMLRFTERERIIHVQTYSPLVIVRRDDSTYTGIRDPRWTPIILAERDLLIRKRAEDLYNGTNN